MRNYYPLISALAAIALLLLPVVILIGTSKKSDPVPSEDKTRTASDDELDDLRKQLTSVSSKLRELEATGNAPPEARELSADKASDPRKMPPQGLFPEAGGQQQASAAEASDIQRIENRIDELNKNLASLIEAQQSAAETATRNSILATEKPEKLDVAKSTEPVSSEEETPAPVDPDTMTDEPAAVPNRQRARY